MVKFLHLICCLPKLVCIIFGWVWGIALLKISSQGVSNLEKTKGQYFLSKESYFFTLYQLGCSDTPEPDWGPPGPGLEARAMVLGLLSHCCQGLETGGASRVMGIPISTPCTLMAHHQQVFISMEKGLPRGSSGHGPQPRCSKVDQLLLGVPGRSNNLTTSTLFLFSPPLPF